MDVQQTKRHHYVPQAYLKAFRDANGRVLVYRKDKPSHPLYQTPEATQLRRYYYSQPMPDGGQDNNTLEQVFSDVETPWPDIVERLHRREDVNDQLDAIFQFISLQRVRVPASRDAAEAMLAQTVKDSLKVLIGSGIATPPPGLEPEEIKVAIDPHQSIHAMATMLEGIGELFSRLGLAAVHNATSRPFLTSDNPVIWFDPSLPFREQRPYTMDRNSGEVFLFFPVSSTVALSGSTKYKEIFEVNGLLHSDVPDERWVEQMNAQVCRFGYEAVIAQSLGQDDLIREFSDVSPVHEAAIIPGVKGLLTIHQQIFGRRVTKPNWPQS